VFSFWNHDPLVGVYIDYNYLEIKSSALYVLILDFMFIDLVSILVFLFLRKSSMFKGLSLDPLHMKPKILNISFKFMVKLIISISSFIEPINLMVLNESKIELYC
jgi:hypothetical protein